MIESTNGTPMQRKYCRVNAYIPMEYRFVRDEEKELVKSRIAADIMCANFDMMPQLNNHSQSEPLSHLNKKLDTVIQMLAFQLDGFHALPFKFVSLSGNGMKFSSQQHFSPRDILEFKMILPLQPPVAIYVYGDVVRMERQTNGYFINACFSRIDEMIRDKIIHYVFEMERNLLRKRRCSE
jgi:hypothetical protein